MAARGLGLTTLFFIFLAAPLSASMVSFLVIETGLRPETGTIGYSTLWEDGLMGVFFDSGHIVSNSPMTRLEKQADGEIPEEAMRDLLEAGRGGAQYFVLLFLDHRARGGVMRPHEALVKVFAIEQGGEISQTLIYEGRFPAGAGGSPQDEYAKAQETAKIVAAQLKDR